MDIGDSLSFWLQAIPPPDAPDPACDLCEGSGEADCEVQFPGDLTITRVLVECACKDRP